MSRLPSRSLITAGTQLCLLEDKIRPQHAWGSSFPTGLQTPILGDQILLAGLLC